MSKKTLEPILHRSDLCQECLVEGHRFAIEIHSTDQHPEWCLEVVDEHGMSHVWDATFDTDREALQAAIIAFEDEGAAGFLQLETNVVQWPKTS